MTQLEAPEREQVLSDAYDADPSFGVAGFDPPGMVTTAAAALALDLDEHVKAAGRVRFIDVTRGWAEESHAASASTVASVAAVPTPPGCATSTGWSGGSKDV